MHVSRIKLPRKPSALPAASPKISHPQNKPLLAHITIIVSLHCWISEAYLHHRPPNHADIGSLMSSDHAPDLVRYLH